MSELDRALENTISKIIDEKLDDLVDSKVNQAVSNLDHKTQPKKASSYNKTVVWTHIIIFFVCFITLAMGFKYPYGEKGVWTVMSVMAYCITFLFVHFLMSQQTDDDDTKMINQFFDWIKTLSRKNKFAWTYSILPFFLLWAWKVFDMQTMGDLADFVTVIAGFLFPIVLWALSDSKSNK